MVGDCVTSKDIANVISRATGGGRGGYSVAATGLGRFPLSTQKVGARPYRASASASANSTRRCLLPGVWVLTLCHFRRALDAFH